MVEFFLVLSGLAGMAAFALRLSESERRRLAALEERVLSPSKSGLASVVGEANATSDVLAAPLSGRQCLAWHVSLVLPRSHRHRGGLYQKDIVSSFSLKTVDGEFEVHANPTALSLQIDHRQEQSLVRDLTEPAYQWLASQGFDWTNLLGLNLPLQITEGIVHPGETVRVTGVVRTVRDPQRHVGYRENTTKLLIEAGIRGVVTITDKVDQPESRMSARKRP